MLPIDVSAKVHPDEVKAGDNVTLQCLTSCTEPQIVWFKDGEPLSEPEFQAQPRDYGKYVCAVEGQESVQSDPVVLDVQCKYILLFLRVSGRAGISVCYLCNLRNSAQYNRLCTMIQATATTEEI